VEVRTDERDENAPDAEDEDQGTAGKLRYGSTLGS
jgi:hypothetical protein